MLVRKTSVCTWVCHLGVRECCSVGRIRQTAALQSKSQHPSRQDHLATLRLLLLARRRQRKGVARRSRPSPHQGVGPSHRSGPRRIFLSPGGPARNGSPPPSLKLFSDLPRSLPAPCRVMSCHGIHVFTCQVDKPRGERVWDPPSIYPTPTPPTPMRARWSCRLSDAPTPCVPHLGAVPMLPPMRAEADAQSPRKKGGRGGEPGSWMRPLGLGGDEKTSR